jgi:hypothetical protein
MKTPVKLLLSLTFLLFLGILNIKSVFAIDKCTTVEKNFNNHIDIIFKNIKSLENCIKPASKYRLKSCIKRKQEGSKGFNCLPELSKSINSNKKMDCKVRLYEIERSLQHLALLDECNTNCQKDVK